jgi:hypothetical protein
MPDPQSRNFPDFVAAHESGTGPFRRFGRSRYFRFGWERTLVNRMPVWLRGEIERTQERIEINPKVVLLHRGPASGGVIVA